MEKITSISIKSIVAKVNEIIEAIALIPGKYDDTKLRNDMSAKIESGLNDVSRKHGELARAQNAIVKEIKAIEIPKPQNLEPLLKRIKALEDKPQYAYDDAVLKSRIKALESKPEIKPVVVDNSDIESKILEIEKSIESINKRTDYLKRTYSEKWAMQQIEIDKVKLLRDEIDNKIKQVKSNLTCSCDAQSALKVADYTRRTMTEKYTAQQFQIDKIQSMLSK